MARFRNRAALTASGLALLSGLAMAQQTQSRQAPAAETSKFRTIASVAAEVTATYTDNYRRLPEVLTRFDRSILPPAIQETEVSVEPPDNSILAATLKGGVWTRRPAFNGFINGSLRVGSYSNKESLNARLRESANPPTPETIPATFLGQTVDAPVAISTFGFRDDDELFIDPNVTAAGTLRLGDSGFFIDGSLLAQEQAIGRGSVLVQDGIGQANEEVTYGGGSLSPYFFRQFGDDSSLEVRFRSTAVLVLEERFNNPTAASVIDETDEQLTNDSFSNDVRVQFTTGEMFDRVTFSVGALARAVKENGSDVLDEVDFTQSSASLDAAYALGRTFSLTTGIGYDDVSFDADETTDPAEALQADDLGGFFWKFGFRYAPTRRSSIALAVGERYGATSIDLDAVYRPSERIRISAFANRQLESGLQDLAAGATRFQSQTFDILSRLGDIQGAAADDILERAVAFEGASFLNVQQGQVGITAFDRYGARVSVNMRRTNFGLGFSLTDSENAGRDATNLSANADFSRQLTRRLGVEGVMRYGVNEGVSLTATDPTGTVRPFDATEKFAGVGLNYAVGPRLSVVSNLRYSSSEGEGQSASGTRLDYEENGATIGVRWIF